MRNRTRGLVLLIAAVLGVLAFVPTFVLVSLVAFGALGTTVGNTLLLLDIGGALLGVVAGVLALLGRGAAKPLAILGGFLGLAAAAGYLVGTWPWDETIAVRNLLVLHVWAPILVAAALLDAPRAAGTGSGA